MNAEKCKDLASDVYGQSARKQCESCAASHCRDSDNSGLLVVLVVLGFFGGTLRCADAGVTR